MLSPSGRCRTFDENADGYVRSEGCAIVVLKRLDDALQANDRILGVIQGSSINQDGDSNGLTAPNMAAQIEVMRHALDKAQLSPKNISYVEAHGTGTSLGDPIEIQSIAAAYGQTNPDKQTLFIGSVKSNIGHLEAAAGIAGLIKVIASLKYKQLPANLHHKQLNHLINVDSIPATILVKNATWKSPRVAGISSFGFSGTNAHLIISELPPVKRSINQEINHADKSLELFTLSAKTPPALTAMVRQYRSFFKQHATINLTQLCFTIRHSRSHLPYCLACS